MLDYSFFSPPQIVFGWGRRSELGTLGAGLGKRALIVSGSRTLERTRVVYEAEQCLRQAGLDAITVYVASREPTISDVDDLTAGISSQQPTEKDVVVAIGGGSTIDFAKAAAAMVTNANGASVIDFLEGVGKGAKITRSPLPLIAMPTTAGTGAEATKNAVISSNASSPDAGAGADAPFKKSLRSDWMIPRVVLIDPELTVSLPADITAATGMDAITQLIESYVSRRSAPIPDGLCLHGLKFAIPALPLAFKNTDMREAREAMSHAALLSGMALANSGLGLAHGVAAALGITCGVTHGLACAVMLPVAMRVNREVCQRKFAELEALFDTTHSSEPAAADAFVDRIERLCWGLGIPDRLRDIGVRPDQLDLLVAGSRGNSMSGNPRDISDSELREILEQRW